MLRNIIIPYIEGVHDTIGDKPALVIMDNFKGQITRSINDMLELHNIHVTLLPPNTTDLLQPMDISVNKPAKDFLKRKFKEWYCEQVTEKLEGNDIEVELQPVNLLF